MFCNFSASVARPAVGGLEDPNPDLGWLDLLRCNKHPNLAPDILVHPRRWFIA
jgi:hypothetical protein